jgi:hypothetical protein
MPLPAPSSSASSSSPCEPIVSEPSPSGAYGMSRQAPNLDEKDWRRLTGGLGPGLKSGGSVRASARLAGNRRDELRVRIGVPGKQYPGVLRDLRAEGVHHILARRLGIDRREMGFG